MVRILIVAALLLPTVAHAQTAPSGQAAFAGALAQNLSVVLAENDALKAQVADLQKQLAEKAAAPTTK